MWDLKGTGDTSYWRKVAIGQLLFYEIAVRGMTGQWPRVSGLVQPMCPEPVLPFHFSEDDRRQMFATICSVAADIWRGELPQNLIMPGAASARLKRPVPSSRMAVAGCR